MNQHQIRQPGILPGILPGMGQREFERRLKNLYATDTVLGPRAVALALKALAVGCPPEGRQFFLSQMRRALKDSERMLKVKRGWEQYGVSDPWWVVHHAPEKPLARYNSEPSLGG